MLDRKLRFGSDYMEGAHPKILQRLVETNMHRTAGYGLDEYSASAREKIRLACQTPEADVFFLIGGTQTNATVINALLRPYQGVIAAETGHISIHEAGAIEYGGHKVLTLPHNRGKMHATDIQSCIDKYWQDDNREHMVMPGMLYISHPTEYGTLYTCSELQAIHDVCRRADIPLFLDGARLAYALACPENDITLADIGHLTDVFYIGGTKCGALFGEAVVFPQKNYVPHFFSIMKQHGALLAKGRVLGLQFDTLFTNHLYTEIGKNAIQFADRIRVQLEAKDYTLPFRTPTNQIFLTLDKLQKKRLTSHVEMAFWEQLDDRHTIMRIATSWATREEDVEALLALL